MKIGSLVTLYFIFILPFICRGETTALEGTVQVQGTNVVLMLDSDYKVTTNKQSLSVSSMKLEGIGNFDPSSLRSLVGQRLKINGNVYFDKVDNIPTLLVRSIPSMTTSLSQSTQGNLVLPNRNNITTSKTQELAGNDSTKIQNSTSTIQQQQNGLLTINQIQNIKINNLYVWNNIPQEVRNKIKVSNDKYEYYRGNWEVYKSMQNSILEIHGSVEFDLGDDGNFTIRTEEAGGTFYCDIKSLIGKWCVFTADNKDYIFFAFTDQNGEYVHTEIAPVISRSHSYLNLILGSEQISFKRTQ